MDYLTPDSIEYTSAEVKPLIIYGGPLFDGKSTIYEDGALFIEDGKVKLAGSEETVFGEIDREIDTEVLDTQGRVIFPGMINLHHDFMAPFTRGLSPVAPVMNFRETLQNLSWKFEQALDEDAIQLAALLSIMESIRHGVTTVFNHHASTGAIEGSLAAIAAVVDKAEIRAVLAHEISDRSGKDAFHRMLLENTQFIAAAQDHPRTRGVLGMHANFTLSENSLAEIADRYDPANGIHIHCGEDPWDKSYSKDLGYKGSVDRLNNFGLITNKAILADGLHLSRCDITLIENTGAVLVHNPESNANNHVGQMQIPPTKGVTVGVGTSGMSSSMLHTLRAAYLLQRQNGTDETTLEKNLNDFFFINNAKCAGRFFPGNPGLLTPGSRADVVIFDYVPVTPFHSNNYLKHLIFGMYNSRAHTVITDGKIIFRDNIFLTLDEEMILEESREASMRVWQKYVDLA